MYHISQYHMHILSLDARIKSVLVSSDCVLADYDSCFDITLLSDAVALYVWIEALGKSMHSYLMTFCTFESINLAIPVILGVRGRFSRNGFLFDSALVKIQFFSKHNLTRRELEKNLKIRFYKGREEQGGIHKNSQNSQTKP
jgi:hypothetical protein